MTNDQTISAQFYADKTSEELYKIWFYSLSPVQDDSLDKINNLSGEIDDVTRKIDNFSSELNLSSIKKLFEIWFEKWSIKISEVVCDVYSKYQGAVVKNSVAIITALAKALDLIDFGVPVNKFCSATLLLTEGYLQRICI
jgi:hypothetical protein